ncbi:MAG: L,D-transpeptidase family protein [Allosphingosinicella sp.]
MRIVKSRLVHLAVFGLLAGIAPAGPAAARESADIVARADSLAPGEFVWQPARAPEGEIEIVVSVPQQTVYVYRAGTLIGVSTASTGRAGYDTPVGSFPILQKNRDHRSNLYNNAPMPFMQRLTWDGIALHGGEIPGYPASHGCIRLPDGFARRLFAATELGAAVHVTDLAPTAETALAAVRDLNVYTGMGGPDEEAEGAAD